MTKHILPVDLPLKKLKEVENLALKHTKLLMQKLLHEVILDIITIVLSIKVNTQPGMTELSLVPEIAKFKVLVFIT